MPTIAVADLRTFAERVVGAVGLAPEHARTVATGIAEANLRGVDSHGAVRLPQYAASIRTGEINPDPRVSVIARLGATALVDADGGYGYAPSLLAMDTAVELAREHGIALAGVRNSHHFGMGALYVIRAAEQGMIGWVTTTSAPVIAPAGGTLPLLGNNPIACGIPRRAPEPPIVLDMALSQVAYGRIRLAAAEGRPIPSGWAFDGQGRPTTDAAAALAAGSLAPIGGYKGSGLSLVGEILAGVLTGSPFGSDADAHARREGGVGHFLVAIDPAVFVSREQFEKDVERLVAEIRGTPPADGVERILLPGEPEAETRARRLADGIPISDELAGALEQLAADLGVDPPRWTDR